MPFSGCSARDRRYPLASASGKTASLRELVEACLRGRLQLVNALMEVLHRLRLIAGADDRTSAAVGTWVSPGFALRQSWRRRLTPRGRASHRFTPGGRAGSTMKAPARRIRRVGPLMGRWPTVAGCYGIGVTSPLVPNQRIVSLNGDADAVIPRYRLRFSGNSWGQRDLRSRWQSRPTWSRPAADCYQIPGRSCSRLPHPLLGLAPA